MYQYHVKTKGTVVKIKEIYQRFLQDDLQWFYSFYPDHLELRISNKSPEIEKYLKKKRWKFSGSVYADVSEGDKVTARYFREFVPILHNYALLCLKAKDEYNNVLERTFHMIMNMMGLDYMQEAHILAQYAVYRAAAAGLVSAEETPKKPKKKASL